MKTSQLSKEIVEIKDAISIKEQEIKNFRTTIAEQSELMEKNASSSIIKELEATLETLAVSVAMRRSSNSDLQQLESEIRSIKEGINEKQTIKDQTALAISGLNRLIEENNAEVKQLNDALKKKWLHYLKEQANEIHLQYLSTAEVLKQSYLRLFALNQLCKTLDFQATDIVPEADLVIPVAQNLKSGEGIKYINQGIYFSSTYMGFFPEAEEYVQALKHDLKVMQLDL